MNRRSPFIYTGKAPTRGPNPPPQPKHDIGIDDLVTVRGDPPTRGGVTRIYKVTKFSTRSLYLEGVNCPDGGWTAADRCVKMTFPTAADKAAAAAAQTPPLTLTMQNDPTTQPKPTEAAKARLHATQDMPNPSALWRKLKKRGAFAKPAPATPPNNPPTPPTGPGGGGRNVRRVIPAQFWEDGTPYNGPCGPDCTDPDDTAAMDERAAMEADAEYRRQADADTPPFEDEEEEDPPAAGPGGQLLLGDGPPIKDEDVPF